MLRGIAPLGLNGLEILCIGLVLGIVSLVGRALDWTRRESLVALALIIPVVILTAAEATQFMTMDEWAISGWLFDPAQRGMKSISLGAFFTGTLITLPLTRVLELVGADKTLMRMILKAAWWLIGNGLITAICISLLRLRNGRRRVDPTAFAALFTGLAVLPTTQLALKTLNYDLFSFGLGTISVLFLLRTVIWDERALAWPTVIAATLAAQEKLVAGPILVIAIVALAVGRPREGEPARSRAARAVVAAAAASVLSLLITMASLAAYRLLGAPAIAAPYWGLVLGPISSWSWIPLGLLWPIGAILEMRAWIGLASVGAVIGVAAGLAAMRPLWASAWRRTLSMRTEILFVSVAVVAVAVFAAGAIGVLTIQPYWAPFHPTPLGKLASLQQLNGVALHVGASTYGAHLAGLSLYAMAVLVIAVPSGVWLAGFVGIAAIGRHERNRPVLLASGLLIVASLLIPIAAALTGMPFAHRYFNLSIALLACGLLMPASRLFGSVSLRWVPANLAAAAFVAVCCIEAAPFRPLFAAFRPFWLDYADARRAEPGRLNASWMGWGEEILTGGKQLEAACLAHDPAFVGVPCSDVTLYVMHSGLWLPGPSVIRLERYSNVAASPPLDRKSFYIVNRLFLITEIYPIPRLDPDFVVAYRGYALAWIYRGDRLAAAGYRFR